MNARKATTHEIENKNGEIITVYGIYNDVNGNPRYVIHYASMGLDYETAKVKANLCGARVYRAKWFGGGFVFSSYNLRETINALTC